MAKTDKQITARIMELAQRMSEMRKELHALSKLEDQLVVRRKIDRLEGNIGALEWVVREGN